MVPVEGGRQELELSLEPPHQKLPPPQSLAGELGNAMIAPEEGEGSGQHQPFQPT